MKTPVTRRRFLVGAGCLCGGAIAATKLGRSAWAAEAAPAFLATCRDELLHTTGQPDCWSALKAVGANGVEAVIDQQQALPGLFHPTIKYTAATKAGLDQVAADAKAAGQRITALLMHNRFEEQPEQEIQSCTAAAQAAQALGIPTVRIDVVPGKLSRDEFLKLSIETLTKLMAATESTGVTFAVENHSNTTNDPVFLRALFSGVGSKRLGLTLDAGNFYWFGHPLPKIYELVEEFAPRVFHTHCKNIRYPDDQRDQQRPMGWKYDEYACPIDKGDVDYARIAAILRKTGYRNDFCVEDEFLGRLPAAEATKTLAREIEFLQHL